MRTEIGGSLIQKACKRLPFCCCCNKVAKDDFADSNAYVHFFEYRLNMITLTPYYHLI